MRFVKDLKAILHTLSVWGNTAMSLSSTSKSSDIRELQRMETDELIKSLLEYKSRMNDELDHIIESLRYQFKKEQACKELDTLPFLPTLEPNEGEFKKKPVKLPKFLGNVNLGTISFDNLDCLKQSKR